MGEELSLRCARPMMEGEATVRAHMYEAGGGWGPCAALVETVVRTATQPATVDAAAWVASGLPKYRACHLTFAPRFLSVRPSIGEACRILQGVKMIEGKGEKVMRMVRQWSGCALGSGGS
ncbi:hypothetical protein TRIUR3_13749 [Triticum urartu]|uniref:Uncharacterized protein n=1 Tax=Triticum urartu TaxID=4572 RepID=M7YWZ2_TRIUA|nr:hypothetical protein TRIUR3_13749 [Triticum urartu]